MIDDCLVQYRLDLWRSRTLATPKERNYLFLKFAQAVHSTTEVCTKKSIFEQVH